MIPALAKPKHVADDVRAGLGPVADAALRTRMETELKFQRS